MKKFIIGCFLVLAGCSSTDNLFSGKPVDEYYLYETTTRKCFKVQEYKDEYKYQETDCRKISPHQYQIETPNVARYIKEKVREDWWKANEDDE